MKRLVTLLLLIICGHIFAQDYSASDYPITNINITLPANPDANTANWSSGSSLLTISATSKPFNGKIDPRVAESKILVTIKQNGAKVCGAYTANTAPEANFSTIVKVWTGSNATGFIGQDCTLQPGEYEVSVQFFGEGAIAGRNIPLSDEQRKYFTIPAKKEQNYQAPQGISPANETVIKQTDIQKPVVFRWIPVLPKTEDATIYRVRVWQVLQGQTATQAMNANQPFFAKDVTNVTQVIVPNLIGELGGAVGAGALDLVWSVQALDKDEKPIGGNNGTSGPLVFSTEEGEKGDSRLQLISPANGAKVPASDKQKFTWLPPSSVPDGGGYRLTIVEVNQGQTPAQAFHTNKPFFEKDSIEFYIGNKPFFEKDSIEFLTAAHFIEGKTYAWDVQVLDAKKKILQTSDANDFSTGDNNGNGDTRSLTIDSTSGNDSTSITDTTTIPAGDTIYAGENGEFMVITSNVTNNAGQLTGKGKVKIGWLGTYVAVEFKNITVDAATHRLQTGLIVTTENPNADASISAYPKAWAMSLLTGPGAQSIVNNAVNWSNNQVNNLIDWVNNIAPSQGGQPLIDYQNVIPPQNLPDNSLKMPFGVQFNPNQSEDKLVITEMSFKPNTSELNLLAQGVLPVNSQYDTLGFTGQFFEFHPTNVSFSSGRVLLAQDVQLQNVANQPKMKWILKKGTDNSGCYIEWDDDGLKDVGLGIDVKFTRDWLLPVPASANDSVTASFQGFGSKLNDIILTGNMPECEIVGAKGMKLAVDSIALDLSESRTPSFLHFPKNYLQVYDTTARDDWEGFYAKTLKITLPDAWKTASNNVEVSANDIIIDNQGLTMEAEADNVLSFPDASVAEMGGSIDTVKVSFLKGSLTDGYVVGKLVLPISSSNSGNELGYKGIFAVADNSYQLTVASQGTIQADIMKGSVTLNPGSSISCTVTQQNLTANISLNGTFKWANPSLALPTGSSGTLVGQGLATLQKGINNIKMEMSFTGLGLSYTKDFSSGNNTGHFNLGSWSFASPQKILDNFPVSISNIHYKPLTTGSGSNGWTELIRGALMMDVNVNLTDDIGGSTTVGVAFAIEANAAQHKMQPVYKGICIDRIEVHADAPAVKIDGSLDFFSDDPTYGDGFLATLDVRFNPVSLEVGATVQFGNTVDPATNQYYRYWRVEANALFEPGIPFMSGLGFYGFGGGAFYNMEAKDTTINQKASYTFKPKKSSLGFQVQVTIGTIPEAETFNADLGLLASFDQNTGGLTLISFTGNCYIATKIAERDDSKIKGNVMIYYTPPTKIFHAQSSIFINTDEVSTPGANGVGFEINVNGYTNKWHFEMGVRNNSDGTATITPDTVQLHFPPLPAVNVYSYFMFGNDIPIPNGFTPQFAATFQSLTGHNPNDDFHASDGTNGVNDNTATGKGIALGSGITFDTEKSFSLGSIPFYSNVSMGCSIHVGAEFFLSLFKQTGCTGINGWRASGGIGAYAQADAYVNAVSNSIAPSVNFHLLSVEGGAYLMGEFPKPTHVQGRITGRIQALPHKKKGKKVYYIDLPFDRSFDYYSGLSCASTTVATDPNLPQQDKAADYLNQLIVSVSPATSLTPVSVSRTLDVAYGLTPGQSFDVGEAEGNGTVINRTFKMDTTATLEVENSNNTWSRLQLNVRKNNMSVYQYYYTPPFHVAAATVTSLKSYSGTKKAFNSNNTTGLLSKKMAGAVVNFLTGTVPATVPAPTLPDYPNTVAPPSNHLDSNKIYRFTVVAVLKEFKNGAWQNALTQQGQPVTQTKIVNFNTGIVVTQSTGSMQHF